MTFNVCFLYFASKKSIYAIRGNHFYTFFALILLVFNCSEQPTLDDSCESIAWNLFFSI